MGRLSKLLGIANNLADSFVSVTNLDFLHYVESLPADKTRLFDIDLLRGTITPDDLGSDKTKRVIQKYKNWFLSEIKKMHIELRDIEKVSVKVSYMPGKTFAKYYTCNTTISAKGKKYTKKVMSSYS